MNLGIVRTDSRLGRGGGRRIAFGGLAMAVGALGLAGVHPARGSAAAGAAEPTTTTVPAEAPPTTSTVPAEASTTTAPPTTTTSAPPVRSAASRVVPAPRPASEMKTVEAIADGSKWDWRGAGVRFSIGFFPGDCCHWGVYDSQRSTVWIGPTAFDNEARLRYVVLHELAHTWQYRTGQFAQLTADYQPWGWSTIGESLEAGADCIANVWGATGGHYWSCPSAAQALAARRLAGDWH